MEHKALKGLTHGGKRMDEGNGVASEDCPFCVAARITQKAEPVTWDQKLVAEGLLKS